MWPVSFEPELQAQINRFSLSFSHLWYSDIHNRKWTKAPGIRGGLKSDGFCRWREQSREPFFQSVPGALPFTPSTERNSPVSKAATSSANEILPCVFPSELSSSKPEKSRSSSNGSGVACSSYTPLCSSSRAEERSGLDSAAGRMGQTCHTGGSELRCLWESGKKRESLLENCSSKRRRRGWMLALPHLCL